MIIKNISSNSYHSTNFVRYEGLDDHALQHFSICIPLKRTISFQFSQKSKMAAKFTPQYSAHISSKLRTVGGERGAEASRAAEVLRITVLFFIR